VKTAIPVLALVVFLFISLPVKAAENNYITPVFPVRAREYWRQGTGIGNIQILSDLVIKYKLPSTWLLHYDVLTDPEVIDSLPAKDTELGLFLEVTRKLAADAFVAYDWEHGNWSRADKIYLSAYTRDQRQRLIDTAFGAFKNKFGYYPVSYGAWYVDVWSMEYIRDKYGADIVLGLSDQYSTDGYQVWGQYPNLPYFVSKTDALEPALNSSDSTEVIKLQWAPREPALSYGKTPEYSNFSTQVNDYARGKNLDNNYFSGLLDTLTHDIPGPVAQVVVGIEAGELEEKYFPQLDTQMKNLRQWEDRGLITDVTFSGFNDRYRKLYSDVSPPAITGSLQTGRSMWWYADSGYRIGVSSESGNLYIDDLRFYHQSAYRDDDQIIKDNRQNLVRMVPAVIDSLVLDNRLLLGKTENMSVNTGDGLLAVSWQDQFLTATPGGITVPGNLKDSLNAADIGFTENGPDLFISPPPPVPVRNSLCHSDYGSFAGRFVCLKVAFGKIALLVPDIIFSKLENQIYLGLRTGFETFWGLRIPALKMGRFVFEFPILDNFLSLRKKLTPEYKWQGRQELEILPYGRLGTVYEKGKIYGQEAIEMQPSGKKLYENSYYAVFAED
jgi:hypothetical protein